MGPAVMKYPMRPRSMGTYTTLPYVTSAGATITNLLINQTYFVRVRAFRMVGTARVFGGYSSIVSAKPVPIAPTLSVTFSSYNSLRVSWPTVSGTSAYDVYVLLPGTTEYVFLITTAATSYDHTGLTTGAAYAYKAVAYSQVGDIKVYGPQSAAVTGRPTPQAVTGFTVAMPGVTTMALKWNAVTGATGYDITRATSSTGTYSYITSVVGATTLTNTGLTFYRYYYYKIRPYTLVNNVKVYGPLSAAISGRTIPSQPQVTLTNPNNKTNVLSWAPISGAQGYVIYYAKGSSSTFYTLKTLTGTSFSHTGVALNTTYKYRIRAYRY